MSPTKILSALLGSKVLRTRLHGVMFNGLENENGRVRRNVVLREKQH